MYMNDSHESSNIRVCPFCGDDALLCEKLTYGGGKLYGVGCMSPMCPGSTPQWCLDADSAIELWNTRDDDSVDRVALLDLADHMDEMAGHGAMLTESGLVMVAKEIRDALGVTDDD